MAGVNSLTLVATLICLSVVAVGETSPPEPPKCPIRGQIYYPECAPCDGTCKNLNPVCTLECKPGCACPEGQVVKHERKCVDIAECVAGDPICPIPGQIYSECAWCNRTCEDPNRKCIFLECKPGCACPPIKVLKTGRNGQRCVRRENC